MTRPIGDETMETAVQDAVVGGTKGKTTKTDKTKINSAYGNSEFTAKYPKGLEVSFSYDEYDTDESAAASLHTGDLKDLVNAREKSNARSAAIAKATADYKPDPNSAPEIRKRMIADAMKGNTKLTEEQAGSLVDSILGV